MLSGVSPFAAETVSDVIAAVLTREPPPLADVPPRLAGIVSMALQKDKARRYQTATDLQRDLTDVKHELDAHGVRGQHPRAPTAKAPRSFGRPASPPLPARSRTATRCNPSPCCRSST